jgi:hypothetical protein
VFFIESRIGESVYVICIGQVEQEQEKLFGQLLWIAHSPGHSPKIEEELFE